MAKRKRRRSRKNKSRSKSVKSIVRSGVDKLAAPVAFWQQLSDKDYQVLNAKSEYVSSDYVSKLKVAANILTGSMTGKVLFSEHYDPTKGTTNSKGESTEGQPRINPMGIINKWVGIGIAGKIYGTVGKNMKLPESRSINKVANKIIFGGIVGGFFDPPNPHQSSRSYSTSHITPVITQNRAVTRGAMQYDLSTQGAFR